MGDMSIKTTLGQLLAANDSGALKQIAETIPPGGYQFRVAKLLDFVEREILGFRKQNEALVKKYSTPDDKGNYTMIGASVENVQAFNAGMQELVDEEVIIPYEPILWAKLGEGGQSKLSIAHVRALGPLLVESDAPAHGLTSV